MLPASDHIAEKTVRIAHKITVSCLQRHFCLSDENEKLLKWYLLLSNFDLGQGTCDVFLELSQDTCQHSDLFMWGFLQNGHIWAKHSIPVWYSHFDFKHIFRFSGVSRWIVSSLEKCELGIRTWGATEVSVEAFLCLTHTVLTGGWLLVSCKRLCTFPDACPNDSFCALTNWEKGRR